jgi:ParB-like chromosome segregation protein Spo0J
MELEPRTTAPAHATGAVEFVPLSAIAADASFRLRDEGDVTALAASIGRLGHLVPVELRAIPAGPDGEPRYQVVAGFRRLAALRLLARDRVLSRIHPALDDDDAWGIALAQALLGEPLLGSELEALRTRLREERIAPWAEELVDEALVRAPVDPALRERFLDFLTRTPESLPAEEPVREPAGAGEPGAAGEPPAEEPAEEPQGDELEVTAEELAVDIAARLSQLNQDLALAFEAWGDLPEEGRRMIVEQAQYVAELFPHLRGGPG